MGRVTIVRPAPFLEARAMLQRYVGLKPQLGAVATLQLAACATYGLNDESGQLLVVMGFWRMEDGREEVFLVGRDAAELAPHLVALSRAARLIIAGRLHHGTVAMVGLVRHGHEPGRRLARLAGFDPSGEGAPPGFERWVRHDAIDLRPVRRRQQEQRGG